MKYYVTMAIVASVWQSCTAMAQNSSFDPIKNMCLRFRHQSVIKNQTLYIDGGIEMFANNPSSVASNSVNNITQGSNNYLITVDLSKSWDWKTNITETAITKANNTPIVTQGAMYAGPADDSRIYLYGGTTAYWNTSFPGWHGPLSDRHTLFSYDQSNSSWEQYDVSQATPWRPSVGAWTEAPELNLGFYFNGEIDSGSSTETQVLGNEDPSNPVRIFLEGLVVLDTSNQTTRNYSTNAVVGSNPRIGGLMVYVPGIGEKGVLVTMGGTYKFVDQLDAATNANYIPMDQIDIFDVAQLYNSSANGTGWYRETASGSVPPERTDSCIWYAAAPDNSSFNIYIYAGAKLFDTYYNDVYVLSLPSFTWSQVYGTTVGSRFGHTCHRVSPKQVITVGGAETWSFNGPCDWETAGVAVLDISSLNWGSVFDADQTDQYTVPTMVVNTIGGSPTGSATLTAPSGGFTNAGLARLFGQNATITSSPSPSPSASHTNAGAIAGGVVGGVIALILVAFLAFCLMRRNRRRKSNLTNAEKFSQAPGYDNTQSGDKMYQQPLLTQELGGHERGRYEVFTPPAEVEGHAPAAELAGEQRAELANEPWQRPAEMDAGEVPRGYGRTGT